MNKKTLHKIFPLLLIINSFIFIDDLYAREEKKQKIAILEFAAYNTKSNYASGIRDIIEVNVFKTKIFQILERKRMDIILKEHKLQRSGCSEKECAIKIGKILSTDKVIIGNINYMGNFTITLNYIDVNDGYIEYANSISVDNERDIPSAIDELVDETIEEIIKLEGTDKEFYIPYYVRAIVPGWGQLYVNEFNKGIIIMSSFIAAGLYTGYAVYDFRKKREEYEDLESGTNEDFDNKLERSKEAFKRANIALAVLGAIYLYNWIDIMFISKPERRDKKEAALFNSSGYNIYFALQNMNYVSKESCVFTGFSMRF